MEDNLKGLLWPLTKIKCYAANIVAEDGDGCKNRYGQCLEAFLGGCVQKQLLMILATGCYHAS